MFEGKRVLSFLPEFQFFGAWLYQNFRMDISYCDYSWVCELSSICVVDHFLPVLWQSQAFSCSASVAAIGFSISPVTKVHKPTQPFISIWIKEVGMIQIDGAFTICKPPCALLVSYSRSVPLCTLNDVPWAGTSAILTVSNTKHSCPVCPSQGCQVWRTNSPAGQHDFASCTFALNYLDGRVSNSNVVVFFMTRCPPATHNSGLRYWFLRSNWLIGDLSLEMSAAESPA